MFKKILFLIALILIVGFQYTSANSIEDLRFEDSLFSEYFSWIQNNKSDVKFDYNWNNFWWVFFFKWLETLSTGEIISLSWTTKTCTQRVLWIYYNSQRWNRLRPLDKQSLSWLKLLDSWYNNLILTWWFFVWCSGNFQNVYGNISHTYWNIDFELIVGVNYNFVSNIYTSIYSGSSEYISWKLNWYIWDNYGWIWRMIYIPTYQWTTTLTGLTSSWNTVNLQHNQTIIYSWDDDYLLFSGSQFLITDGNWNGNVIPPTSALWTWAANNGEAGLSSGDINFSIQAGATWASLIASWWIFVINIIVPIGQSWKVLSLYRSQNGVLWIWNTPDNTCTLDANKNCQFMTDHLSFFAGIDTSYIEYNLNTTIWWGYRLIKDNCLYSSKLKNNLPWVNSEWIDYSPSYYDKTCVKNSSEEKYLTGECNVIWSPYSQELNSAFQYNYNLWTTTVCSWLDARLDKYILRKELAKMMSIYASKIMWKLPQNISACSDFVDIKNESKEMKTYIKFACQLNLMWLERDWKIVKENFNPNDLVTRAEYATVFSRLLYGDKYDNFKWKRYLGHLNALKKAWIMTQIDNPFMTEIRWYIMIMLWRYDTNNN